MHGRFVSLAVGLAVAFLLGFFSAPAKSVPVAYNFQFDVPDFSKPELSVLEQLFLDNSIAEVTGMVGWDTDDAVFVTSNFTFASNIDSLFDQTPDELVFAPSGNLNQIRSWEVELGGVMYLLELTGLDETDTIPNRWFGGQLLPWPDTTYDLTEAGGGLMPMSVPEPATLALLGAGLLALSFGSALRRHTRHRQRFGRSAAA